MNKKRLLKLADLLIADAKNKKGVKFDLSSWGSATEGTKPAVSCNTSACAVGLACVSGAFKSAGLDCAPTALKKGKILPRAGRRYGWFAVEHVFGLNRTQSSYLFVDDSYPSDKQSHAVGERAVARRIRTLVRATA